MRFEIQGNNVSFRTGYPKDFKPCDEWLKRYLPVELFGKTFYIEHEGLDRLDKIIIRDD